MCVELRQRKKARTRERIAEAALELFTRQGFDATTIDQIAGAADVSRRTFFRYYPTKEAALFPDREQRLERFSRLLGGESFDARLEAVLRALLALAADYDAQRELVFRRQRVVQASPSLMAYDLELDRGWEDAIAASLRGPGRAARAERRRARLVAGTLMGLVRATLREWFAGGGRERLAQLGQQAFELLRGGIGVGAGAADETGNRRTERGRRP